MEYTIGEVAKKLKINKETIRYYEKIGLLSDTKRDCNGYRIYTGNDVDFLEFIIMAKEFNFTLKEIASLKTTIIGDSGSSQEKQIVEMIDQKINTIDKEIEKLNKIRMVLEKIKTDVYINKDTCYHGKTLDEILNL